MALKSVSELVEIYANIAETNPGLAIEQINAAIAATSGPMEKLAALNRIRAEVQGVLDEATLIAYLEDQEIPEENWQYYSCSNSIIYYNGPTV